jgi:hypothetical protein
MMLFILLVFAQAEIVRYLPRYSVKLKGGIETARALSQARFLYVPLLVSAGGNIKNLTRV